MLRRIEKFAVEIIIIILHNYNTYVLLLGKNRRSTRDGKIQ